MDAPPGLDGVIVTDTSVGDVRGDEGFYHYRQYDAVALAARRPLEDVWHLLFDGNTPWMLHGEVPDADVARALEPYQIITIDHGFNTSTFAARVITSSGADVAAAVVGGIGARCPVRCTAARRAGPSTCSTPSALRRTLAPISPPPSSGARSSWVSAIGSTGRTTPARCSSGRWRDGSGRDLYANVEFYAGVVMDHCGLPRELFAPTFASSRVIGWCTNILEQAATNRIIRPRARYAEPPPPQPVPEV